MKYAFLSVILLLLSAYLLFILISDPEPEKQPQPVWIYNNQKDIQFGLRHDGVVIWRKLD